MRKVYPFALLLLILAATVPAHAKLPLPPLPPLLLPAPPPVVVVPGSYVYFAPGVQEDLLFYRGYWYRPNAGRWYRASRYDGPWMFIPAPPRVLVTLTPGYRDRRGSNEIPHDELKRNWKNWERDRHWDHDERREHKREAKHEAKREDEGKKKHHDKDDKDDHGEDHDRAENHRGSHGRGH